MKKLLTSVAGLVLAVLLHAQQTTHPGYIVRAAGDTIHGFLEEQLIGDLTIHIGFKNRAADNSFTTYTTDQVKAFQYDDGNAYRAVTFTDPRQEHAAPQTSFARLLVDGECELYSFHEKSNLYFLARKDTLVHLLYDDDLHAEPYIQGNFRNELNFFAVGCESARGGIERLVYSEEDLQRFFRSLDACLAPDKATVSYFHKAKARFGFYAYAGGFLFSDSRSQFTGEARLRLTYPQLKANVSFNLGLRYVDVVKQLVDENYVAATVHHKVTYNTTSIPFTIQYNFTRGLIQPFIFTGLAAIRSNINSPDHYVVDDFYDKKWGVVWLGGAGVEAVISDAIQARIEWRYMYIAEYPTLGIAVRF
jgi:hypothetical protein